MKLVISKVLISEVLVLGKILSGSLKRMFILRWPWLSFAAMMTAWSGFSQSSNDLYSDVQRLEFNQSVATSTEHNSVQRACVDENLTGQCIQYHNDQWFSYTPSEATPFYVNVYGQSCQKAKGVQLVVFTGELCETSSYQILACISIGNSEDYYFKVEAPEVGQDYFFILDGYLEDFCDYEIEVAGVAKGLPALPGEPTASRKVDVNSGLVSVGWVYEENDAAHFERFAVVRSGGGSKKKWVVPMSYNTKGTLNHEYFLADTLTSDGLYKYDVYLVDQNAEHQLYHSEILNYSKQKEETLVFFPFSVPRKSNVQVTIFDPLTGRALFSRHIKNYNEPGLEYDFAELIQKGKFYFQVQIQDLKTLRKEVFKKSFPASESGEK